MSDMASPKRMGGARSLTPRRYAMFTLVGIAGEDDLDAPDLNVSNSGPGIQDDSATSSIATSPASPIPGNGRAGGRFPAQPQLATTAGRFSPRTNWPRLREGMLAEIESIASSEAAITWANTMLRAKNTLTADDARSVEAAFETKIARLGYRACCSRSEPLGVPVGNLLTSMAPKIARIAA